MSIKIKKYEERNMCCICKSINLSKLFNKDIEISLSLNLFEKKKNNPLIPYNILTCRDCNTTQNNYLGNLDIVYEKNHNDSYGKLKNEKHQRFKNFIIENKDIKSICEIGAATGELAFSILEEIDLKYTIIEKDYHGARSNKINIINNFFEEVDTNIINSDCLIMSDLFEHFYNPLDALEKIRKCNFKYVILNHPDFDHAIKNFHSIILNIEHTFLIENQLLFNLYFNYGYKLNRRYDFKNFSIFIEFKKIDYLINEEKKVIRNLNTTNDTITYIKYIERIVKNINKFIIGFENKDAKFYIWPCSVHSTTLFLFGLYYNKFDGILDNSPNKIDKYIDGYDLLCSSFDKKIKLNDPNDIIFISGADAYIKELNLKSNCKIHYVNDFC